MLTFVLQHFFLIFGIQVVTYTVPNIRNSTSPQGKYPEIKLLFSPLFCSLYIKFSFFKLVKINKYVSFSLHSVHIGVVDHDQYQFCIIFIFKHSVSCFEKFNFFLKISSTLANIRNMIHELWFSHKSCYFTLNRE